MSIPTINYCNSIFLLFRSKHYKKRLSYNALMEIVPIYLDLYKATIYQRQRKPVKVVVLCCRCAFPINIYIFNYKTHLA